MVPVLDTAVSWEGMLSWAHGRALPRGAHGCVFFCPAVRREPQVLATPGIKLGMAFTQPSAFVIAFTDSLHPDQVVYRERKNVN